MRVLPVSVVFVNYYLVEELVRAVHSVLDQVTEVIVVEQEASENRMEALRTQLGFSEKIRWLPQTDNLGFAKGCNVGYHHTSMPYIFFMNPDAYLEPGALEKLYDALREDERIGMVGGFLCDPSGREQRGGRRKIPTFFSSMVEMLGCGRWFPNQRMNLSGSPMPAADRFEVEAISGACMLVRRVAIDKVGLWDEGYFMHGEDLDWCVRFRKTGFKIMFVPGARVFHEKGKCSARHPVRVAWHKHRGMIRFFKKFISPNRWASIGLSALVWSRFGVWYAGHVVTRMWWVVVRRS